MNRWIFAVPLAAWSMISCAAAAPALAVLQESAPGDGARSEAGVRLAFVERNGRWLAICTSEAAKDCRFDAPAMHDWIIASAASPSA